MGPKYLTGMRSSYFRVIRCYQPCFIHVILDHHMTRTRGRLHIILYQYAGIIVECGPNVRQRCLLSNIIIHGWTFLNSSAMEPHFSLFTSVSHTFLLIIFCFPHFDIASNFFCAVFEINCQNGVDPLMTMLIECQHAINRKDRFTEMIQSLNTGISPPPMQFSDSCIQ